MADPPSRASRLPLILIGAAPTPFSLTPPPHPFPSPPPSAAPSPTLTPLCLLACSLNLAKAPRALPPAPLPPPCFPATSASLADAASPMADGWREDTEYPDRRRPRQLARCMSTRRMAALQCVWGRGKEYNGVHERAHCTLYSTAQEEGAKQWMREGALCSCKCRIPCQHEIFAITACGRIRNQIRLVIAYTTALIPPYSASHSLHCFSCYSMTSTTEAFEDNSCFHAWGQEKTLTFLTRLTTSMAIHI